MRPPLRLGRAVVFGATLVAAGLTAVPEARSASRHIVSPMGLGPEYRGVLAAGSGLAPREPSFGAELGNFVLQPRFFAEGRWTSNFFRVDSRNGRSERNVFSLHVRPGLALYNPDPDNVSLSFSGDADLRVPLSSDQELKNQINAGVNLEGDAIFFPDAVFGFGLHEDFERELRTRPAGTADSSADRNRNRVGATMRLKPGGGALRFEGGYTFDLTRYDHLTRLDSNTHRFNLQGRWQFYPLNTFFVEGSLKLKEWRRDARTDGTRRAGNFVEGMPVRAYTGVSGYLSNRFGMLIRGGYGNSLLDRAGSGDFNSFIGQVQATFRFTSRTALHIGGERDFDLAPLGGYYGYWRAYSSLEQKLSDVGLLHADFAFDRRRFGVWDPSSVERGGRTIEVEPSSDHRVEEILRGGVAFDFDLARVFGISVGYRYEANLTDFTTQRFDADTGNAVTGQRYQGYEEHRVFASLNLRY